MSVTAFQDLPLADRDREWDGDAADKRVRKWAGAQGDIDRVKSHLAKYYEKMGETAPWDRD